MKRIACTLLFLVALPAISQDKHPLEDYFTAEIMTEKAMKEVKVHFEIDWNGAGPNLEVEVYHTDLERKIVGLIATVSCPELEIENEVLIQGEVEPYKPFVEKVEIHRGSELIRDQTTVSVKEIRYEEMPEIDDMVTEAKEDEEEDDSDN